MRWSVLIVLAGLGCGGGGGAGAKAPVLAADAPTFERAADSGKVDRVGSQDGELSPDGTNDLAFAAKVTGPVSAIFIATVDDGGTPTGEYQADTLVGNTESPAELGGKPGMVTRGLAVFEGDKLQTATNGSLNAVAAGPHTLTLYCAPSEKLKPGAKLRIFVQRPDGSLVGGAMFAN